MVIRTYFRRLFLNQIWPFDPAPGGVLFKIGHATMLEKILSQSNMVSRLYFGRFQLNSVMRLYSRRLFLSKTWPFDPTPRDFSQFWLYGPGSEYFFSVKCACFRTFQSNVATRPGFRRFQPRFQSPQSRYFSYFSQLITQPGEFYRESSHRGHDVFNISVNLAIQSRELYRELSNRSHDIFGIQSIWSCSHENSIESSITVVTRSLPSQANPIRHEISTEISVIAVIRC